jgi:hypothetical protein
MKIDGLGARTFENSLISDEDEDSEITEKPVSSPANGLATGGQEIVVKKKRVRKNRTFKFFCGCGKGYTSTPALYLHIKIKHEGKMPAGTTYPNINQRHRGRPIV